MGFFFYLLMQVLVLMLMFLLMRKGKPALETLTLLQRLVSCYDLNLFAAL